RRSTCSGFQWRRFRAYIPDGSVAAVAAPAGERHACHRGCSRSHSREWLLPQRKSPPCGGLFRRSREAGALLDLAFLVDHVLADDGTGLLDLRLRGRGLLALDRGLGAGGLGRGGQPDIVARAWHGVLIRP